MLCPCERLEQQQGKMQSDKMCPVTLGNHKTKTPIGRHPWQPPTPAGFEQGVPWRSPCEHSNSSRIRAHAKQNAVRQNAFRYLRNPYKTKSIKTRMQAHRRQKLWISSRIQAKRMPKNSFTSPLEPIKNNKKQCFGTVPKHPNWSGSETPEH